MFNEVWIAYIDYGDGYTENLITLKSQMEMFWWMEEYLERRWNGYFHNGHQVFCKKHIVV